MNELTPSKPQKWARNSLRTESGLTYATEHNAKYGPFEVQVTNYPGSRVLSWSLRIPGKDWAICREEDRCENSVKSCKRLALAHADKIIAASAKNSN